MTTLNIGTARARPGEKSWGQLRIREKKQLVLIPVAVLNGKKAGPHLVFIANQHGPEINGLAAIREFVNHADPKHMRGTIVAFPTANPLAARINEHSWLEEHEGSHPRYDTTLNAYANPYNMNANWPGKTGGTLAQRVVYEIWNRAIMAPGRRADFVLDIHSHQATSAAYVRNDLAADLALVTGYRPIVITGGEGRMATLNGVCVRHHIMALSLEAEGQHAFYPHAVAETVQALCNLAVFWKVLPGVLKLPPKAYILDPWRSQRPDLPPQRKSCYTCYAHRAGLFITRKRQYDPVVKNEVIGEIIDPHTVRGIETIRTPMRGALYMIRTTPSAVNKGDRLMTVSIVKTVAPRRYLALKKLDCSLYTKKEAINAPSFNGRP